VGIEALEIESDDVASKRIGPNRSRTVNKLAVRAFSAPNGEYFAVVLDLELWVLKKEAAKVGKPRRTGCAVYPKNSLLDFRLGQLREPLHARFLGHEFDQAKQKFDLMGTRFRIPGGQIKGVERNSAIYAKLDVLARKILAKFFVAAANVYKEDLGILLQHMKK
jgi:hypothetical protein